MKKIFVVDDSPTIRTAVSFALKPLSAEIVQAENGKDAIGKIDSHVASGGEVAFIIADMNMPEMDGIEFIREFRKKDSFTPVFFLTTESSNEKYAEAKKFGATGYYIKPFKTEDLLAGVRKYFR